MNKLKIVVYSGIFASILVGCGEKVMSVEYYAKHPEELEKVIKNCDTKPVKEQKLDQNCINAATGLMLMHGY